MEVVAPTAAVVGPALVGTVFLASGIVKALDPQQFVRHLSRLGLFPHRGLVPSALLLVATECALGAGLLVGLWLEWLIPVSAIVLVGLAGLTWWSVGTGRVEDCGCYNGLIDISPRTSVLLDLIYLVLLSSAWLSAGSMPRSAPWKITAAVATAGLGALLASVSYRQTVMTGAPLVRTGPLKVGRRWRGRWLPELSANEMARGAKIVVFLTPACTLCKRWIQVLNLAHGLAELPEVIGVVALSSERVEDFRAKAGVRFPVVGIKPWSLKRLTRGELPAAVLMEGGEIRELWVRSLPAELGQEIRQGMVARRGATLSPAGAP